MPVTAIMQMWLPILSAACLFRTRSLIVAISLAVAEHLYNYRQFLEELKRVARWVIITTPSPAAKLVLESLAYLNLVNAQHIADHKHYLSQSEISALYYDHSYFLFGLNQIGTYGLSECSEKDSEYFTMCQKSA